MFKEINIAVLFFTIVSFASARSIASPANTNSANFFAGVDDFSHFIKSAGTNGETVLLSPEIKSAIDWNELIVSWDASAPTGTFLKVEARGIFPDHKTKFYTMGLWSPDNQAFPRTAVRGQRDADGTVDEDTLKLKKLAGAAQIRLTIGGTNSTSLTLKYLGLIFSDTKMAPPERPPNTNAWGKIIPTPERSQFAAPDEHGWCSPTSTSMILARWSEILHRPEMTLSVPQVAAKVYDRGYKATGDWPFNTAFAGSFSGMRAYVSRFDDLSELEDWIAAGIPVAISARWDLMQDGRPLDDAGHLTVCIGFTKDGDLVINDPATHFDRGQVVRRIYKRANVARAWATSHNTVYLIFPVGAKLPENRYHHW